MHIRAVYCCKYVDFMPNFVCIIMQYRPKMFISGVIENKLERSTLILCVFEPSVTKLQCP